MDPTTILAWIRAYDGNREVWTGRRYLALVDMTPDGFVQTAARLDRLVEQAAAYDKVHTDPATYELELLDYHTGLPIFRWIYTGGAR